MTLPCRGHAQSAPLTSSNNHVLKGLFGTPASSDNWLMAQTDESQFGTWLQYASHASSATRANESLQLDGETARFELHYRRRIGRYQVGVSLPWVRHSGGQLDAFIENWHKLFGLPNGNRDARERNLLEFNYTPVTGTAVSITDSTSGPGDLRAQISYRLNDSLENTIAADLFLKLPTGDADKLTGSGGTDIGAGVSLQRNGVFDNDNLTAYLRGGVMYFGDADIAGLNHKSWSAFIFGDLSWQVGARISLAGQLAYSSAVIDSGLDDLSSPPVWLTLGGRILLAARHTLEISVSEDINVESVPDVTMNLRWVYTPQ